MSLYLLHSYIETKHLHTLALIFRPDIYVCLMCGTTSKDGMKCVVSLYIPESGKMIAGTQIDQSNSVLQ